MDLEQYKKLAFKNNTFEIKALEESLNDSKMNAYQYLRQFQLESTGYRRFDFNMQDIYRTNKVNHVWSYVPRRWLFFIDYEFINVGKRLDYKRSTLFEKDLDYNNIINNPNLFDSSFLVFINGKLYTEGIKILCKEDKTFIIFICKEKPSDVGFKIQDMLEYIENNAQVTIFFIPNVGITNINTNAYRLRSNGAYKGLPYRIMNLSEHAVYDNNTLTFAQYNGENVSTPINVEFGDNGLFVDDNSIQRSIDLNPKNTTMNIQLIPLRYLFEKVVVGNGNKWFKLPMQDYPVASDNCLVFDSDGNFIHDAKIRHYYPNVYSIENVDDIINEKEIHVYTFYYFNKHSVLKHKNIIEVYHKYMPDYLERYKNGLIPQELLNFEPPKVEYSIKDFQLFNSADSHFVYKVEKMKEFIRADVNNFRNYLRKLHVHNNYYYVDVSKIDLSERVKTDNSNCGLEDVKSFDTEMYMFVFRNDFRSMYDKLLIHIDGLRYETIEIYSNDSFDFVYIPCELVTEETVIEIEKLTQVMKEFPFTGVEDVITIDITEFSVRNKTLFNDLFLVDVESSEYVDPSRYKIIFPFDIDFNPATFEYIKSKNGFPYYYLEISDENKVKLVQPNRISPKNNAGYVRTEDSENGGLYQLNIDKKVSYDLLEGDYEITKHINDLNNPNTRFIFRIVDGSVKIDVINDSDEIMLLNDEEILPDVIELNDVFLRCPRYVKILLLDEELYGRQLELHIKKNFRIAALDVQEEADKLQPILFNADMKNDRRYVRIYRNGKLVPRHLGTVRFPIDFHYTEMEVYPGVFRNVEDHIMVELMPYMMNQVCYMETIPDDDIIDLTGMIDKPFDFRWYDIYINGRKLVKKDVEILSANKIKILKTNSLRWLEIIENSRDKEYFGYEPIYDFMDILYTVDEEFANRIKESIDNMYDLEEPVVDKAISILDYLLRRFYDKYLVHNYGLINPDLLQIDRYTVKYYKDLLYEEDTYLPLNPDLGKGELILPINPDSE